MIDSISPVSVQHSNAVAFKGELPYSKTQSQEKHGMSAAQKTLLGLGALATATAGILLAKKHLDTKFIKDLEKKAKDGLQIVIPKRIGVAKPEVFDAADALKLIDEDIVKYGIKKGDSAVIIPKSAIKEALDKKYHCWFDGLSDNAFMYCYQRADGGMYGIARYFDPKTIGPGIADNFKKGNVLEIPIQVVD